MESGMRVEDELVSTDAISPNGKNRTPEVSMEKAVMWL